MGKSSTKKTNRLSPSSSTSPTSSNGKKGRVTNDRKEGETTAEFRRLVVQEQVRSLRRRLWHAFQNEDGATALRAYTATARDLQAWVREEVGQAKEKEELRLQEAKVGTTTGKFSIELKPMCLTFRGMFFAPSVFVGKEGCSQAWRDEET